MRPGMVATIRVNPKDCMAVLDVMEAVGITIEGMSFPAMVSLTLSSLLQTARDNGQIPTRDGFEFSQMMAPYIGQRRTKKKLEIAKTMHELGSSVHAPKLSKPRRGGFELPQPQARSAHGDDESELSVPKERGPFDLPVMVEDVSTEQRLARRRLTELLQKKDLAEEQGNGVVWSPADEKEFQAVYREVYPEG